MSGTLLFATSITINLFSIVEAAFGQSLAPVRAYDFAFKATGTTWSYGPAAALGFAGFLNGVTPLIVGDNPGGWMFAGTASMGINNGAKYVVITNTGGGPDLIYTFAGILGAP